MAYSPRRTPYSDIIRAEAPYARNDYMNRIARERQKKQLGVQRSMAEKGLAQSAQQFQDTLGLNQQQLEESKRQFEATNALQRQQMEEEAARADLATGISTIGLGIEAYPYVKDAAVGLGDLLFAESATPTASTIATTEPIFGGVETATAGAEAGSGASGGLGAAGNTAAILALIAGQNRLTGLTNTEFEGQKTGDFFTFDEQGRWSPRLGNEPWHGFMNQQWGIDPSAGEKWDAAVANNDWGLAAKRTPSMVQQWLNPVGDFGYDAIESRWGSEFAGTLDPIIYSFDKIGEAEDIGDFFSKGGQASAKVMDPVGTLIGEPVENFVEDITGSTALGEVANVLVNPFGAAADFVGNWSYLCTETQKIVGLGKNDKKHLDALNEFGKDHPLGKHYHRNAPKLIVKINESEDNLELFYSRFYIDTIAPVVQLIKHGKMVEARNRYLTDYLNLLDTYTPELYPEASNATL